MDSKKQEYQPLLEHQVPEFVITSEGGKRSWKVKASIAGAAILVGALALTLVVLLGFPESTQGPPAQDTVLQSQSKTTLHQRYAGYKVLAVEVKDGKYKQLKDIVTLMSLDVWKDNSQLKGKVSVAVPMISLAKMEEMLQEANLEYETDVDDVKWIIDQEQEAIIHKSKPESSEGAEASFQYDNYNTYEQIESEIKRLANHCPAGFRCEVLNIGQSYENNNLAILHIYKEGSSRKAIWLDSLIHCREWITGATLMNIIKRLIYNYGVEESATKLMDSYNWYFLPVMNPDGYIYTWTTDRLWRQNRQPNKNSECVGTDLNRNYEFMWGGVGASTDPCNNEYRGDYPASAPETQHMQKIIKELSSDILAWISLHSCAELWLTPWAFTESDHPDKCDYPEDYPDLFAVADKATRALDQTNHQNFTAGNWCQSMYASSGVLQDHVKAIGGVKYAYTLELRGGNSCFIVGPDEIIPSANEVYNGIIAMADAISELEDGALKPC